MKKLYLLLLSLAMLLCPSAIAQSGFDYELDETNPLINSVDQLSSPWSANHFWEGDLSHLLDGDPDTYWHSNWNDNVHKQYVQVALEEPVHELISLKFTRRWHKYNSTELFYNEHVTKWGIYGADSPDAADTEWIELLIAATPFNSPGETINTVGFDTKGKQYLRIYGEETNSGNRWWHAAEIQLYPCVLADELTAALKELLAVYESYEQYYYDVQDNAGTAPGQYTVSAVAAFVETLDRTNEIIDGSGTEPTLDEVKALTQAIKDTYQAVLDSKIPLALADGYYRLRHGVVFRNNVPTGEVDEDGNPLYENIEVPKYMYTKFSGGKIVVRWHTPDFNEVLDNCPALWKVTNKDGLFDIVNCATDSRFDLWSSSPLTMSTESKNLIAVELVGNVDGAPQVTLRVSTQGNRDYFHPLNHGISVGAGYGTGVGDVIIGWANDASRVSEWVFEPVPDAEAAAIIEAYAPYKDQNQLVDNYKLMIGDAKEKLEIAKDLSVSISEEEPLIHDVEQLSSPWSEPELDEGYLSYLLDNDPETYWHSNWHSSVAPHTHYLQVALEEPVHVLISMQFSRRWHNYQRTALQTNDHVTLWSICGADSPDAEDEDWIELAKLSTPYSEPGETLTTQPFDTQGKQYLRIYADATNTNRGYWHIAALQLYPGQIVDPANSQYHMMGSVGTALNNALLQLADVNPDEVTLEQFTLLKAAYDPFIAKFVDPRPLRAKITEVQGADEIMAIGNDPGFWSSSSASDNLKQAISEAKAYDQGGKYTSATSDALIAKLDAAASNIQGSANPVQTGKWYRFRFGTEEEYAEHNWPTGGNETQYRTVEGEATETILNETIFGKYMTVARLERVSNEDEYGSYTENFVLPIDKEQVVIGANVFFDAAEDIEDQDMALFRFVSVGDTALAIQNKATGLYLQRTPESGEIHLGVQPSFFTQVIAGYGQNAFFIKNLDNAEFSPLHLARNLNVLSSWGGRSGDTWSGWGNTDGRRGCYFIEEVEDVASDYSENTARIDVWDGAMIGRCYPVSMKAMDDAQGTMWSVSSIEREAATDDTPAQVKVNLVKIEGNEAAAGRPFIYVKSGDYVAEEDRDEGAEPDLVAFTFGSELVKEPTNDGALKGVFAQTTIGEGVYTVGATTFNRTDASNAAVSTNGVYVAEDETFPRNYKVVLIFDDNGEDAVTDVLQKVAKSGNIYTLDGRLIGRGNINKLNNMQPGIYIINGVKVVVK